jgi:hypothetical protein
MAATAGGMTKLGLSGADLRTIGRENATALFPRLRTQWKTVTGESALW